MINSHIVYRPEIDGLRAISIIPVVLYHAGLPGFKAGFIGVDIFFVISGYLITSILLSDIDQNRFSLTEFYERRCRRILPALFAMVLVCVPVALMLMTQSQFRYFSRGVAATGVFGANFLYWFQAGYFDVANELKPLIHTWSLATEEQFYLLYPLVLLYLWRRGVASTVISLLIFAIFSVASSVWFLKDYPVANFYLLHGRAWELLLGSLVAIWLFRRSKLSSELLGLVGLGLIISSMWFIGADREFPSYSFVLPVLGAALVIAFADSDTIVGRMLSFRPLVGIGLISYSLYLWHQPILAFARLSSLGSLSSSDVIFALIGSVLISIISWKFIELPFRRYRVTNHWLVLSIAASFVVIAVGLLGNSGAVSTRIQASKFVPTDLEDKSECVVSHREQIVGRHGDELIRKCFSGGMNYILIGDSHAGALSKEVREVLNTDGSGLITLLDNGCLPIPNTSRTPLDSECLANKKTYWKFANQAGATVIVAARWRLHLLGNRFNNREGGIEYGKPSLNTIVDGDSGLITHVESFLRSVAMHTNLIVIGQIPEAGWNVPERLARIEAIRKSEWPSSQGDHQLSTSFEVYISENSEINGMFDRLVATSNVKVFDPSRIVCNSELAGRCMNATSSGDALYRDDNHPSPHFAGLIAGELVDFIGNASFERKSQ